LYQLLFEHHLYKIQSTYLTNKINNNVNQIKQIEVTDHYLDENKLNNPVERNVSSQFNLSKEQKEFDNKSTKSGLSQLNLDAVQAISSKDQIINLSSPSTSTLLNLNTNLNTNLKNILSNFIYFCKF